MPNEPAGPGPSWASEPETGLLRALQSAIAEAETSMARRLHVSSTDLSALSHLTFATDVVGPGWLAGRLGLTPGAVTELVDRLARAGHLERHRDTADRRRVRLEPTGTALQEVGRQLVPLLAALDAIATGFDATERAVIQRFLNEAVRAYRGFAADSGDAETN